jgi:hypothetical protein
MDLEHETPVERIDALYTSTAGLSFSEALASGYPFRRRAWLEAPNPPIAANAPIRDYVWVAMVALVQAGTSPFISLCDGSRVTLGREDLLARDYEVLGHNLN